MAGEAKRRGIYEQRVTQAKARQKLLREEAESDRRIFDARALRIARISPLLTASLFMGAFGPVPEALTLSQILKKR